MRVTRIATADALAPLAATWNCLTAGVPFRRHEWLATWWRHYGDTAAVDLASPKNQAAPRPAHGRELFVLAVDDDAGNLVGVAPWYLERSVTSGRVLRFLGDGEVCSDYLSLLSTEEHLPQVASAIADYLCGAGLDDWDAILLDGVDANDAPMARLADQLAARDAHVLRRPGLNCWRLELPASWDEYLGMVSKSHRGLLRKITSRLVDTGRAVVRSTRSESGLDEAWRTLVTLHQRRRQSLGEPGCFASPRFAAFHGEASRRLARCGSLQLDILTIDGQPAAAEYGIVGGNVLYIYQSGIEPDLLRHEPGRTMNAALVRDGIGEHLAAIDFMRGDEPYKPHLRAKPSPSVVLRIIAPTMAARWRHRAWLAGDGFKRIVKRGLQSAGVLRTSTLAASLLEVA